MMWKTVGLVSALLLASAAPALAESACSEPIPPVAIDGSTASTAQMNAAHDDVMTFLKQSDDYQLCLLKELKDATDAAKRDKKDLDPAVDAGVRAKVQANQILKEKVGAEFNAAVRAYKAKHPS